MIKQKDLKKIRLTLGYTQQQFADMLHCSIRMYQNYEWLNKPFPLRLSELLHYKIGFISEDAK